MKLAKESNKYDFMVIQCALDNKRAKYVYEKVGFKDTGEIEDGESVMRLKI